MKNSGWFASDSGSVKWRRAQTALCAPGTNMGSWMGSHPCGWNDSAANAGSSPELLRYSPVRSTEAALTSSGSRWTAKTAPKTSTGNMATAQVRARRRRGETAVDGEDMLGGHD